MRHFRERQLHVRGSRIQEGSMVEYASVPGHRAGKEWKVRIEGLSCLVKDFCHHYKDNGIQLKVFHQASNMIIFMIRLTPGKS